MKRAGLFSSILNPGTPCDNRGLIEINGTLTGEIHNASEVLIASSGRFCGRIQARKAEIAGLVEGDVEADSLVIHASGRLYYDKLRCQHLFVKDGGTMVDRRKSGGQKSYDAAEEGPSDNIPVPDGGSEGLEVKKAPKDLMQPDNGLARPGDSGKQGRPDSIVEEITPPQARTNVSPAATSRRAHADKQPLFYSSY